MTVHLVGAGPGDPQLITRRGAALLASAGHVVYDRASMTEILALAPSATRHCVGKQGATPAPPQHEINALLIELGRTGACVVRLKAGDPFVVSRGGEEAVALAHAGVEVDVVPGVSAAVAAPAAAGIPVISAATRPQQRAARGTLARPPSARLPAPLTVVIGDVAALDFTGGGVSCAHP